ncbi:MAG: hypothetical protein JAY75_06290 [Candidatus Thiodiazotropha taylori]|nr:hypothetical protein [Candidatus Thiodiazotropha taylori]MCW4250096.1 hypothetical protein [Candidatus Thiodiazotropha endolucinida]MCG7883481.1 hypothetical protein [Candidatus Thiodiazotropha taylori]MCG8044934.1 hypothetical protein [Candidatus Thiodiazotropha taylori]MCG8075835.1 hypothetical protein [Candidatus Thiodiazotropha taylori]
MHATHRYGLIHTLIKVHEDICNGPASVAQSDARLTGDQEDVGSKPAGVGNILLWGLIIFWRKTG